jgi:lipid-A-disaccharide synthase-like uncharacterized protein
MTLSLGRGALEWKSPGCLAVALFLVNHLICFMALAERNLLSGRRRSGLYLYKLSVVLNLFKFLNNHVPVNMMLLDCHLFRILCYFSYLKWS